MYYNTDADGYAVLEVPLPCFGKGAFRIQEDEGSRLLISELADQLQQVVDRYAEAHQWYQTIDGKRHWIVPVKPKVTYLPTTTEPIAWEGPTHRRVNAQRQAEQAAWNAAAPRSTHGLREGSQREPSRQGGPDR